ncbi:shootin-1-like isoform X4 [Oratosquilla oratoria]|uniref:shootin-1-like isoform X4 n=1 Tax=Oratosquilla oratoria TaxID=337810 RepID=UPI003F76EAE1
MTENGMDIDLTKEDGRNVKDRDWKDLYEKEVERRKTLMKLAQKVGGDQRWLFSHKKHKPTRDYDELKRRYTETAQGRDSLQQQLDERDYQLQNLRNVSEAVYHEYDSLKTRYEVEAETMAQAFNRASEWYHENKNLRRDAASLKRQSAVILQRVIDAVPSFDITELGDLADIDRNSLPKELQQQHEQEVKKLMDKISELESEVARLHQEASKAHEEEFEAQEELIEARRIAQESSEKIEALEVRVKELEDNEKRIGRASVMVLDEVESLQAQLRTEAEKAEKAAQNAAKSRREHAALARQSAVLLGEAMQDDRLHKALEEIHELTTQLHAERDQNQCVIEQHKKEIAALQSKDLELEIEMLNTKIGILEEEVVMWQGKANQAQIDAEKIQLEGNNKASAMSSLIDQIKKGGIQLKSAKRPPPSKQLQPQPPDAVQEMKNILATMKRGKGKHFLKAVGNLGKGTTDDGDKSGYEIQPENGQVSDSAKSGEPVHDEKGAMAGGSNGCQEESFPQESPSLSSAQNGSKDGIHPHRKYSPANLEHSEGNEITQEEKNCQNSSEPSKELNNSVQRSPLRTITSTSIILQHNYN